MASTSEWFIIRRGRGLYTRTLSLPLWTRLFVPCTFLQTAILVGVNVAISVLADDCLTALVLGLSSLTTLFMCYFAVEAVRTENAYQLTAYLACSGLFLSSYLPPVMGMSDGPHHVPMSIPHWDKVRNLLLVAFICTVSLQLCVLTPQQRPLPV